MKTLSWISTVLLTLGVGGAVFAESPAGKILTLNGKAQIFNDGKWQNAGVGTSVYSSSTIQTGYNSKAIIVLRNGAQISLKPNTTISFNQFVTGNQGSTVELQLVNGAVNSFVPKAEAGQTNELKIRSPTVVAGVRGSFISARRYGEHFSVKALHSPARLEAAPAAEESDAARANLLTAVAQKEGLALQADEAKACLGKGTPDAAAAGRLADADTKAQMVNSRIQTLRVLSAQYDTAKNLDGLNRQIAEKTETMQAAAQPQPANVPPASAADIQAMREELRELKAEAGQERRKLEGLNRVVSIAEGNGAQTQGDRVVTPYQAQLIQARPHNAHLPGQTRIEGHFFFNNFDNQAGLGNDFQRLFNHIHRFSQPTQVVVPAIRTF